MSTTIFTYNGKVLVNSSNNKWLKKYVDPYNPLGLPAGVMRFEAEAGWSPSGYDASSLAFTQVSETPNVWDLQVLNGSGMNNGASGSMTKILGFNATGLSNYSRGLERRIDDSKTTLIDCGPMYLPGYVGYGDGLFQGCTLLESVGALYTPDLVNAYAMFESCSSLLEVPSFIISNITNMGHMFYKCSSITHIPLFDTSKVTDISYMWADCVNVESGALALYQQASSQTTPPTHSTTFYNCGINTVTGTAELAQIPSSWGGTAA